MDWHRSAPPALWRVPDDPWTHAQAVLVTYDPPKRTGRPRIDPRAVLDAIIFYLRSGCQ
jgi:hypothetical protein